MIIVIREEGQKPRKSPSPYKGVRVYTIIPELSIAKGTLWSLDGNTVKV